MSLKPQLPGFFQRLMSRFWESIFIIALLPVAVVMVAKLVGSAMPYLAIVATAIIAFRVIRYVWQRRGGWSRY